MWNKIWKFIDVVSQPKIFKMLVSMHSSGYLSDIGWIDSFKYQIPIDKNNNPLPWVTYSFIEFVSDKLNKTMDIFEFGSGNSTLWYASKVKTVTSVEHDETWFEKIKQDMPKNVNIFYEKLVYDGVYSKFPNVLNKKFDIIIVDGRDRVNCVKIAINNIKENGVIILDDSERESYQDGIDYLLDKNFKKIDFWGIAPGIFFNKCTTIFYRNDNCIGI